jgi:hypothetical protein
LVLGSFGYAPIRFLWLIALGLFLVEIAFRREHWRPLLVSFAVTLVAFLARPPCSPGPCRRTVGSMPSGSTTMVGASRASPQRPAGALPRLPSLDDEQRARYESDRRAISSPPSHLQNTRDLRDLLLDPRHRPGRDRHWNERGRLHPGFMVPVSVRDGPVTDDVAVVDRAALLQALLWGFSLRCADLAGPYPAG